ncbi:unnamed protein product [Sphagnum jensenii]|uniref:Uncharacterized protein n=1 Tax=Sphagnum jensenii TaxID=128206 RepID=A0ABP1BNI8_9BRYO
MPISSFSDNRDKACDTCALLQRMLSINSDHQLESMEVISNHSTLTTFFSRLIHIHELTENVPRRDESCRRSVLSEIFLLTGAHVCVSLSTSDLDNIVSENGTAAAAATTPTIMPVKMEQACEI